MRRADIYFAMSLFFAGSSLASAEALIGFGRQPTPPGQSGAGPSAILGVDTDPFFVFTIATIPDETLSGLDTEPETGVLFASSGRGGPHPASLFRLDVGAGTATLVGSTGFAALPGIAFAADGTLYGSASTSDTGASDTLIRIDPDSGDAEVAGEFGFANGLKIRGIDGIAFHPTTGILYGASGGAFDGTPGDVFAIDTETGAATLVGSLIEASASIIIDPDPDPDPDPGSGSLPAPLVGLAFDATGNLFGSLGSGDGRVISINLANFTFRYVGDGFDGSVSALTARIPDSVEALIQLTHARADLFACESERKFVDVDADGRDDVTDSCPNTPIGIAVDDAGCSLAQFCQARSTTCPNNDWRNDEPLSKKPADCIYDKKARTCS